MKIMGYTISDAAQEAGRAAIQAQRYSFSARKIGEAIEPHITSAHGAWARTTPAMVARAVAEHLLWEALRAGLVKQSYEYLGVWRWRHVRS